jgi:hypothetical protein
LLALLQVLHGQADGLDPTALPLKVSVSVVGISAAVSVVGLSTSVRTADAERR